MKKTMFRVDFLINTVNEKRKSVLLFALFCGWQTTAMYSQTTYINSANVPLTHLNELKIGNSPSATERAKNMIKIGDGSRIQIGEWEVDDRLSFKASMYNFTNGYVGIGIGTAAAKAKLDVNGSVYIPTGQSYWIGSNRDSGNRLRLHHAGSAYIDFAPNLYFRAGTQKAVTFLQNGNVEVYGTISTKAISVTPSGGADFVFNNDYHLKPLSEVKHFIKENKHLPEIPSAAEMTSEGVDLGEMQMKLLQKTEELTLYVIQQQETIEKQQN